MRVAAAQTPEFRDNVEAATLWAVKVANQSAAEGVRLLVFPEGYLQGYFTTEPDVRRVAIELGSAQMQELAQRLYCPGLAIVIGMIEADKGRMFNTAAVLADGKVIGRYRKAHLLPGEAAFTAGTETSVFEFDGSHFGVNICFDTNFPGPAEDVKDAGGMLLVCPCNNSMPCDRAAIWKDRHNAVRSERCRETGLWLLSADVTGERDGRAAWGPTAMLDPQGAVAAQLPLDAPGLLIFDLPVNAAQSWPALPRTFPIHEVN